MDNFKGSEAFLKKFQNQLQFASKQFKSPIILAAGDFNRYLEVSSYQQLIDISQKYGPDNCLAESRQNSKMINLFFDYDCKNDLETHAQASVTLKNLKSKIQTLFPQLNIQFFVKESEMSNGLINSMHIIAHFSTPDGYSVYFDYSKGCAQVKHFVSKLNLQHPYDHKQVYSGHLLRLMYSNKFDKDSEGNKQLSGRIFDYSVYSDLKDDIYSLSSYCPNPKFMLIDEYVNKHFILQYVKGHEYTKNYIFNDIIQRPNESHLSLTLTEQRTPVCEHKSNNAVCMFYNDSNNPNIIIKCQDVECGKFFQTFFHYDDNTHRCQIITTGDNTSDRDSTSSSTNQESASSQSCDQKDLLQQANNNFQYCLLQNAHNLHEMIKIKKGFCEATGMPINSKVLTTFIGNKLRNFKGENGKIHYDLNGNNIQEDMEQELIDILDKIEGEFTKKDLKQLNIKNNTFNIFIQNNNSSKSKKNDDEKVTIDFIPFDNEREKFLVNKLFDRRMHYITDLYELIQPRQFIYKPAKDANQTIYYFTNTDEENQETNGGHWTNEDGPKELIKRIRNTLETYFDGKMNQAEEKHKKGLKTMFNFCLNTVEKTQQIQQYAMETFKRKNLEFNQKIHLLHFQNGTYDLEEKEFIKTTPDMYNTQQIRYNYNKYAKYDFLEKVIKQIVGDNEYQWFIQQLAYCLMPDRILEKKQIVILTGQGNNGKTLLFNLMNNTVDTLAYGVNGRSQMIQSPNDQLSNATPDLMTLKDMRFCYFAELDAKRPFNQQQVKMLTGAEKVKGRNLYGNLDEFEAHAGLFVSCNQIPKIDTQDGGFINRLKIIQLQKQFLQDPDENNQFQLKKDKRLPNFIKSMKWRQGFMKMLLDYHYKDEIPVPQSIEQYIQQKINLNLDPVHIWAEQHIVYDENDYMSLDELTEDFNERNSGRDISSKTFQEKFDQYLKQHPEQFNNVKYEKKNKPRNKEWKYGNTKKKLVFFYIKVVNAE